MVSAAVGAGDHRVGFAGQFVVQPDGDESGHPDGPVEAVKQLRVDLTCKRRTDLVLGLGASSIETRSSARDRRPWLM
jgi:hypothetical protein